MPAIKIDDKEYEYDTLPQEAKSQLQMLQFVDAELARLQAQSAALQTARISYAKALGEALPRFEGDTIKIS
jgi:Family of unknown function (DUF6447)